MLEAYNDFSKFDTIEFTEDVYSKLHKIEEILGISLNTPQNRTKIIIAFMIQELRG